MKTNTQYIDFKQIKQSVSMEQILDHYGILESLTRKGDSLSGKNPFDSECTNPTRFRVNLSKNCWNVFGSILAGNVMNFVVAKEGCELKAATTPIQVWFNQEINKQAACLLLGPWLNRF